MLHRFMFHHGATSEQDPVYEHVMSRSSHHKGLRKGISAGSELQCSHSHRACSATVQMEHVRLHIVTLQSGWLLLFSLSGPAYLHSSTTGLVALIVGTIMCGLVSLLLPDYADSMHNKHTSAHCTTHRLVL